MTAEKYIRNLRTRMYQVALEGLKSDNDSDRIEAESLLRFVLERDLKDIRLATIAATAIVALTPTPASNGGEPSAGA